MCGMVGFVNLAGDHDGLDINLDLAERLFAANLHRGGDSYGVWLDEEGVGFYALNTVPPIAITMARLFTQAPARAGFFHTRAATSSNLVQKLEHIQPFIETDPNIVFMQNAILHDWKNDALEFGVDTDSQAMFRYLGRMFSIKSLKDEIPNIAGFYDGQQASVLYAQETQELFMWCVMNPLYIHWVNPDLLLFASQPPPKPYGGVWEMLEQGKIYHFQPPMTVLAEFDYHSIYGEINE